jgi:hypothetical protein
MSLIQIEDYLINPSHIVDIELVGTGKSAHYKISLSNGKKLSIMRQAAIEGSLLEWISRELSKGGN